MSYESEVLADSPLVYWRLGEASGTTAADDSGNGHTATYKNGPTLGVTGLLSGDPDTAVLFNGASDQSADGDDTPVGIGTLASFAIECLFDVPASGVGQIGTLADPAGLGADLIELYYDTGVVSFDFQGTPSYSPSATAALTGVHHLVGVYDGSDVLLYVDGALADSQAYINAGARQTVANAFAAANYPGIGTGGATGTLDEVAFYDHALSSARIAAHYAASVGPSTPQILSATELQSPTNTATLILSPLTDHGFLIRGATFGNRLNNVSLESPFIEGLGPPDVNTQDVEYVFADGAYGNPDFSQIRVITLHAVIRAPDAATAMNDLTTLEAAFEVATTDVPLTCQLPGWGRFVVQGRPRSVIADVTRLSAGVIHALCRFDCPDPTMVDA